MARPIGPTFELAASEAVMRKAEAAVRSAPLKARKAAVRALRTTLRTGKSDASKAIREDINLKKAVVDKRIDTRIISQQALVARVAVRDRRIELIEFMTPAQIASAYRRGRARRSEGVSVKVSKQGGRALYPGTFVELGRNDRKWHVLKRVGPEQYPIRIQFGPNLITRFEKGLAAFAARQNLVLDKNLLHELRFILGELGG